MPFYFVYSICDNSKLNEFNKYVYVCTFITLVTF